MIGKPSRTMTSNLTTLVVAVAVGLLPAACGEKKSETPAKDSTASKDPTDKDSKKGSTGSKKGEKTSGSGGEEEGTGEEGTGSSGQGTDASGEGSGSGGTSGEDYKFCDDLKGKLTHTKAFADEICADLAKYRSFAFKGSGATKVQVTPKHQGTTSTYEISSTIEVAAKPADYYDMVRLQYLKPDKFETTFEVPEKVTFTPSGASDTGSAFTYKNEKKAPEEIIVYKADTKFIELKKDVAYAFETKSKAKDGDFQGMETILGLVVVVKKGTSVEVFSRSTQVYNNSDQATDHEAGVKDELSLEQKRSFNNGKNASKAPPLLK